MLTEGSGKDMGMECNCTWARHSFADNENALKLCSNVGTTLDILHTSKRFTIKEYFMVSELYLNIIKL